MSVLDVEKPAFMAEEDIAIFEDAVGKFFDEHAPENVVATWRKNHCVDRAMRVSRDRAIARRKSVKNTAMLAVSGARG